MSLARILNSIYTTLLLLSFLVAPAQKNLIDSLLQLDLKEFSNVVSNPKKYRLQIIYTKIERDANNFPHLTDFIWNANEDNYFYCASMVKLPCSIYAIEKVNELNIQGLSIYSTMITDSAGPCQRSCRRDTSSETDLPSLSHYIKKMLLVSDNYAYSRVYEFLSADYIQNRNSSLGHSNMRIIHRFDGNCKGSENTNTNPIRFIGTDGQILYQQPQITSKNPFTPPFTKMEVGKAYKTNNGKLVQRPKDFSNMNFIPLQNIHTILKTLLFPTTIDEEKRYRIDEKQRQFLLNYLSMYPYESNFPKYDRKQYFDSYKKYFLFGDSKENINEKNIKIFNIVGQSYGFMADCAYIVDFEKNIEFMLSAVIYSNEKEVLNTGKYEYNSIALPYLAKLGKVFYNYELSRKRTNTPNLNEFKTK